MNEILKAQFFVDDLSDDQKAKITDINNYIEKGLNDKSHSIAHRGWWNRKASVLMELVAKHDRKAL